MIRYTFRFLLAQDASDLAASVLLTGGHARMHGCCVDVTVPAEAWDFELHVIGWVRDLHGDVIAVADDGVPGTAFLEEAPTAKIHASA